MESTAVSIVSKLISAAYIITPQVIHKLNHSSAATYTSLPLDTQKFHIRAESGNEDTTVKVFDGTGKPVYTIERNSRSTTHWIVYSALDRMQIAAIVVGLRSKHINYLAKPDLRHQNLTGIFTQQFNLNDGTTYSWTRGTRLLEQVSNPGGGYEETHKRVAQVSLLRRFRFDWELLVDKNFDPEVALFTSFVAMQTLWSQVTTVSSPAAVV